MTESERREIAGRHAARYGRAVQASARHAMSDDYQKRHAEQLDRAAREAAHRACEHGALSPLIDRLERALEMEDA